MQATSQGLLLAGMFMGRKEGREGGTIKSVGLVVRLSGCYPPVSRVLRACLAGYGVGSLGGLIQQRRQGARQATRTRWRPRCSRCSRPRRPGGQLPPHPAHLPSRQLQRHAQAYTRTGRWSVDKSETKASRNDRWINSLIRFLTYVLGCGFSGGALRVQSCMVALRGLLGALEDPRHVLYVGGSVRVSKGDRDPRHMWMDGWIRKG